MIVAFLITLFVLWLLLAPRGRARLAETTRGRPGYAAWMGLGAVLVIVTFWGMVIPGWREAGMHTPFGPSEVWRTAGVLFLLWTAVSGVVILTRGRL
jgi:hypothetical protein